MPRKPVREDDDAVAASKEAPKNVRPYLSACVVRAGEEKERWKTHAQSSEQVGPHSRAPRCFPPFARDARPSTTACA